MSEYPVLLKEDFLVTTWLGPDGGLEDVPPRWQGYSVDLPDSGNTKLYPLRVNSFGQILPHIHAQRMRRGGESNKIEPLSHVNLVVNNLNEPNGGYDSDPRTAYFKSLIDALGQDPYDQEPKLVAGLKEVFAGYKARREAQRVVVARGLSHIIENNELYVVAADLKHSLQGPNDDLFYTARLAGITNVTNGDSMIYKVVARDIHGTEGFLPHTFFVPGGVSAPAIESFDAQPAP